MLDVLIPWLIHSAVWFVQHSVSQCGIQDRANSTSFWTLSFHVPFSILKSFPTNNFTHLLNMSTYKLFMLCDRNTEMISSHNFSSKISSSGEVKHRITQLGDLN